MEGGNGERRPGVDESEPSRRQPAGEFEKLSVCTMDADVDDVVERESPLPKKAASVAAPVRLLEAMSHDGETSSCAVQQRQCFLGRCRRWHRPRRRVTEMGEVLSASDEVVTTGGRGDEAVAGEQHPCCHPESVRLCSSLGDGTGEGTCPHPWDGLDRSDEFRRFRAHEAAGIADVMPRPFAELAR